jgi:hypothetical protein
VAESAVDSAKGQEKSDTTNIPKIESIRAVSLATHDMTRAVQFYCSLGFTVRFGGETCFKSCQTA